MAFDPPRLIEFLHSMTDWTPRVVQEAKLKELEQRLAGLPDKLNLLFEQARLLSSLGRLEEAKRVYGQILGLASPAQFAALNNLGNLLYETGSVAKARMVFQEAVLHDAHNPIGHFNLAKALYENGDLAAARTHYETTLRLDPNHAGAHQGLGNVLTDQGDPAAARPHYEKAFQDSAIRISPYRGKAKPIPLLLVVSIDDSNAPLRPHLNNRLFEVAALVIEFFDPAVPLPKHAVAFNAIGDPDLSRPSVEAAVRVLANLPTPVLNRPEAVLKTGRVENAARLGRLPDVTTARTASLSRALLAGSGEQAEAELAARGFAFPLLLRSPGYHAGRHFVQVGNRDELAAAVAGLPGDALTVLQFLDVRGADGKIRKYRVMMIGGKLYPLHAAVSQDWKVHYFSADMNESPEHRAEDQAFLENMPQVLGEKAMGALKAVQAELGLDYAGIDFSLGKDGELILFEANATMTVVRPPSGELWDYRRRPVQRIYEAVLNMIVARAESHAGHAE